MLKGYIDSVSSDKLTLKGWVQLGAGNEEPHLSLDLSGVEVGTAVFGPERTDVREAYDIENKSFTLTLDEPVESQQLLVKVHQVAAVNNGERSFIPLGGKAYHQMMADFVKIASGNVRGTREVILKALDVKDISLSKHLGEVRKNAEAGDLSYFGFPVGLRSSNDVAQIGRDGHLFLTGGSNALRDQYLEPKDAAAAKTLEGRATAWASAIAMNRQSLDELGISFLQVVVPEKMTALRQLAPIPITGPTPLYRRINELVGDEPHYLSFLELFENWSEDLSAWLRNDTHCSPAGSLAMTRSILERLPNCDPHLLDGVKLSDVVYRNGDLAEKFFDIPLWDKQYIPAPDTLGDPEINLVYSHTPGNFVGSHHIWTNRSAPIKKKLVVFGNSFVGGVTSPTRIGWWFGRLFSEFHLKWEPEVDMDYVQDVRPDFVIAQTIERFLVRPPSIPSGT